MKSRTLFTCAAVTLLAAGSASAQTSDPDGTSLPDPATIELPDLSGAPVMDSEGDSKYFYFHKVGVSFETAVGDFSECVRYSLPADMVRLPGHLVIVETPPEAPSAVPRTVAPIPYTGQLIADLLMPSLMRRSRQGVMRMCMGYKNYKRYPVSKEAYLALTENDSANAVYMQAKLASGPAPTIESVAP